MKPVKQHVETQCDMLPPVQVCDVGIQCYLITNEPRTSTSDITDLSHSVFNADCSSIKGSEDLSYVY